MSPSPATGRISTPVLVLITGATVLFAGSIGARQHRESGDVAPAGVPVDTAPALLEALRRGEYSRQLRIGSLSGPDALGLVESVALDEDGRFYVLDSRNHRLRMYDPNGDLLHDTGGEGQGPGELGDPEDLALDRNGRLLITDRNRRVSIFRPIADSLRYERRFRIGGTPWDTCVLGDRLVVQAIRHGDWTVIDVYDLEGNRLRSFGEMSPGRTLIERETFSWGHVACLAGDRVLYVPRHSNRVTLYNVKGERLWQRKMPDYRPLTVTELSGKRRSFQWTSPGGTHLALRVVPLPDGQVAAVHLGLRDTTSTGVYDVQRRRTLFYDVGTGDLLWDVMDVPPLAGASAGRFLAVRQLPYPTVTAFRLDTSGR